MLALFLLATILGTSPEEAQRVPDYFGEAPSAGRPFEACHLTSQDTREPFTTCRYDCGETLTIGARSVCPFVLQR